MKIIVTGGAGFIGSHIVDAYVKAGHKVVVVDNLSSGARKNLNPKAKFYNIDITDQKKLEAVFKKERPETVNHHAAFISVVESMKRPADVFETNVMGTLNVVQSFARYRRGKGKLLFASTGGALYGDPKKIPADENSEKKPLSPYGFTKLLAEQIIEFYGKLLGFNYTILRYANVYGPRQNPRGEAGVIAIFSALIKKGKQPIIFGNGTKTRDYVFVGDVAQANFRALTKGTHTTINIGTGKETKDIEVFRAIAKSLEYGKNPVFAPSRPGEVNRIAIDAAKAKKTLGWKAVVPFNKGIQLTTDSFR